MLQYSEMRTGNYFFADRLPQSLIAISVVPNKASENPFVGFYANGELTYIPAASQRLQPIALTDALLEKCGFAFETYFKRWQKKKNVFGPGVDMELDRDYTALDFSGRPIVKEIKHLHQLQNLYYALKGEELAVDMQQHEKAETYAAIR